MVQPKQKLNVNVVCECSYLIAIYCTVCLCWRRVYSSNWESVRSVYAGMDHILNLGVLHLLDCLDFVFLTARSNEYPVRQSVYYQVQDNNRNASCSKQDVGAAFSCYSLSFQVSESNIHPLYCIAHHPLSVIRSGRSR